MILQHQEFELWGKPILVKAKVCAPFKVPYSMPNEACFLYVVEGQSEMYAPGKRLHLQAREGMVMQCGNYLMEILEQNGIKECEAIAIHLPGDVLKMIYEKDFPDFLENLKRVPAIICEKRKASALLKNYMDSLLFYFDNPELVSDELLQLKIKELLLLLAKTDNLEAVKGLLQGLFSPVELDFKTIIEQYQYENLSLEQMATLTNLSLSTFKREFSKHYKTSPAKYFRLQKLQKAANLLKNTDLRVSQVAHDSGFGDLAHFSKTFQKEFGVSPSHYRAN